MALTIYRDTQSSKSLLTSLSHRYAKSLRCAYFDRLQAAIMLINGPLSKYAKLTILKYLVFNKGTRGPGLP